MEEDENDADETVRPSCGCVFCDLELEPEMQEGQLMHMIEDDLEGVPFHVPCTKASAPGSDLR